MPDCLFHRCSALFLFGLMTSSLSSPASATPFAAKIPDHKVELVPHRAVYDLSLAELRTGSGVGNVRGRLVLEFLGSDCHGYTLNTRLVTEITDSKGNATLSDLRSSTFEEGRGRFFRFATTQYFDNAKGELTFGDARRFGDNSFDNKDNKLPSASRIASESENTAQSQSACGINVRLQKPRSVNMKLDGQILFPTQHSREILKAALAGRSLLQAEIYDGSDDGEKVYLTATFIGQPKTGKTSAGKRPHKRLSHATITAKAPPNTHKAIQQLEQLKSWPVIISYYDKEDISEHAGEGLPSYELSYILFANGVSRKLKIDYGDFAINGKLKKLEFLPRPSCD